MPGGAAGGKRCRSWYAGNVCQASTFANATWPATNSGVNATGTCIDGYGSASSATRLCNLNGVFSSTVIAACQRTRRWLGPHSAALPREIGRAGDGRLVVRVTDVLGMGVARCAARPTPGQSIGLFCASVSSEQQASWPLTYSGDVAIGTCEAGWTGTPARTCSLTGVFGSISNPCTRTWDGRADCGRSACSCQQARCLTPALRASVRGGGGGGRAGVGALMRRRPPSPPGHRCIAPPGITCSAVTDNYISWPQTLSGEAATGACVPGWAATGSVAPTRECQLTGAFDTVSGSCYRTASACLRAGAHAPPQRATRAMC